MPAPRMTAWAAAFCLALPLNLAAAERTDAHTDTLTPDTGLHLQQVIEAAISRHPDRDLPQSVTREAQALSRRGEALLAAPPAAAVTAYTDRPTDNRGATEIEAGLELPLWRPGERTAARDLARHTGAEAEAGQQAFALTVAGEIRAALWDLTLARTRLQLARATLADAEKRVTAVAKRVEQGDLAQADLLLARNDLLIQRRRRVEAETEFMHAQRSYRILTGLDRYPQAFTEQRADQAAITAGHPLLEVYRDRITRARDATRAARLEAAGRPTLFAGSRRDRGGRNEPYNDSIAVGIKLPFGGSAHRDAAAASAAREVADLQAERDRRQRELQTRLHEIDHRIEQLAESLPLAEEQSHIAERQLEMSELAFVHNEMDLIDLLRLRTSAREAQQAVAEIRIEQQRAVALYNQTVGVMP
ncbi:TolC family protein [Thiohalobacter thiocyanaticus]|uniref:TolC family protein n=1 Tax=Thiohalobacter thiocyanaticus TaxID=585455 RepID=A0A426QKR3_9GAMM|nr:TolC family protein [Thiohalobacter thiocyanaticus]RRQ22341.1 TolC family protein [Thiohalobacter thiocyanaticus]